MAKQYYVLENDHDGQGWFYPLGKHPMYKSEAQEFIQGQHYAYLADVTELGFPEEMESSFKLVEA